MLQARREGVRPLVVVCFASLLGLAFALPLADMAASGVVNTFQPCDVFTAVGFGQINWYRPNTCPGVPSSVTFEGTLHAGSIPNQFMTGMGFDPASCESAGVTAGIPNPNPGVPCLYATMFDSNTIAVFDNTGAFIGTCGGVGAVIEDPESVEAVEGSGGVAPGIMTGGPQFQSFPSAWILSGPLPCGSGSTLTKHIVAGGTGTFGTDWVDMSSDKCTVLYTGEGLEIKSANICTNTQNPDFATGFTHTFALKILPDASVLVADTNDVAHVSSAGVISHTCDSQSSGTTGIFSLDVLPGGAAFATGSFANNVVDYLTVTHCDTGQSTPDFSFQSVQPGQSTPGLFGVAIYGEAEVVHSTSSSSSSSSATGVPEFATGFSSSLFASGVALATLAALLRIRRMHAN